MKLDGKWITVPQDLGDIVPVFQKTWSIKKKINRATLLITALGVYEAELNGKRVSQYVLAPGWTAYEKRIQVQKYDITEMIQGNNALSVYVGKGWFRSPMPGWATDEEKKSINKKPCGLIGEIRIKYDDNSEEIISTDETWVTRESAFRFSEIYDGETYDATFNLKKTKNAIFLKWPVRSLIKQEGEEICEKERVAAKSIIHTPKGETVIDFGQEVTGYVEFTVKAKAGDRIRIQHGEVLDRDGDFYNANYRNAKAEIQYICKDGLQTWHPHLTFFGFRYIKLDKFPGPVKLDQFSAIVVYSDIKRAGEFCCGNEKINRLYSNIIWGQKSNYLDVPTDCPQRDERLGWTGDTQVFTKAATYNYDVEKFFEKWLHDMKAEQREDGGIGVVIPDYMPTTRPSAAWSDACTICPWEMYLAYGNVEILKSQFGTMKRWVDYISATTTKAGLWTGGEHYGDWLGLDSSEGSCRGASRDDFIASAFYAYSTSLVIKTGNVLHQDVSLYEKLYSRIIKAFRIEYPEYLTETEYVLAIQFNLARNPQKAADDLAKMIEKDGMQMKTGFVGTAYILYALSNYGHSDIAYSLLLREQYPSWLYAVNKGATTIWEHWDGIKENGDFWDPEMNSFNHYAYGAVSAWIYEKAAGIQPVESNAGFAEVCISPVVDRRMGWLKASVNTKHGLISSSWAIIGDDVRYEIETDVPAEIVIDDVKHTVNKGTYTYWGSLK